LRRRDETHARITRDVAVHAASRRIRDEDGARMIGLCGPYGFGDPRGVAFDDDDHVRRVEVERAAGGLLVGGREPAPGDPLAEAPRAREERGIVEGLALFEEALEPRGL